jgi:hypothetical protein
MAEILKSLFVEGLEGYKCRVAYLFFKACVHAVQNIVGLAPTRLCLPHIVGTLILCILCKV